MPSFKPTLDNFLTRPPNNKTPKEIIMNKLPPNCLLLTLFLPFSC